MAQSRTGPLGGTGDSFGVRNRPGSADTRTMRTRKPVATSRGNACSRCTALLQGAAGRCSMCGWPAGVGYPPVDGEIEAAAAAAVAEPEPEVDEDAEHASAQLDALAGLAQRQTPPLPEPEPSAPPAQPAKAPVQEAAPITTPALERVAQAAPTAPTTEPEDVDPLTAPLDVLTDAPANEAAVVVEATPIAEVAAEAVAHDSVALDDPADDTGFTSTVNEFEPVAEVASSRVQAGRASSLARPAQLLVVAAAVLNLVLAGVQFAFGSPVDASMTTVVLGLALITLAVWTAAAVTFLYWVSRAYAHVATTSAYRQRHGASMALAGWLIPIAGVFIGYRVLQDLWAGSDPSTRDESEAKPRNARIVDVWLLGLITGILFAYVMPLVLGDSTLWNGIAAVGVAAAGLSLASVISTVSNWQDAPDVVFKDEMDAVTAVDYEDSVTTRVDEFDAELVASEGKTPEPATASTE